LSERAHLLIYLVTVLAFVSMQFQLFIPGKNWRLSLAELASLLETKGIKFAVCSFSKDFFVVKTEEKVAASIINDLGGTIKIGVSESDFPTEIVKSAFLQKDKEAQVQIGREIADSGLVDEMFKTESEKALFGVSVYCAEKQLRVVSKGIQRFVGSCIKRELLGCGKKSKFMGFAKGRKFPQLSHVEVLKKKMVENKAEVLFCVGREQTFVAVTVAVHNPFEFQKRDVGKPVQRKIFAIPPRLARIMVNLAACTEGKVLLDPFCGVGTILQEALLAKAKAIGVDINRWCVEAASRNMEWLKDEYSLENAEYRVLQGDVQRLSQKIGWEQVDCVATEPDLGPALRQMPTTSYAVRIAEKLEPLYYSLLEEAYKVLKSGGRLVLVSPYIKTRSGNPVTMRIEEKAAELGFERVYPFKREFFADDAAVPENLMAMASLVDAEERHKIGREIHVFQK
jgi:tRNA G10  N-methylase Trm11